ncbi:MAG: hypothetical protein WBG95_12060 [Sulfitobacter sp.]
MASGGALPQKWLDWDVSNKFKDVARAIGKILTSEEPTIPDFIGTPLDHLSKIPNALKIASCDKQLI